MRIVEPHFVGIFELYRRETQRKPALTVHHTGATKNIQDLRNFAHFANETPLEKHKKRTTLV